MQCAPLMYAWEPPCVRVCVGVLMMTIPWNHHRKGGGLSVLSINGSYSFITVTLLAEKKVNISLLSQARLESHCVHISLCFRTPSKHTTFTLWRQS